MPKIKKPNPNNPTVVECIDALERMGCFKRFRKLDKTFDPYSEGVQYLVLRLAYSSGHGSKVARRLVRMLGV
jgi:hypothetical protein